ncbi:MAG: hypothetical protein AB1705_07715 [Verrucomicrobiota bacterium]
MSLINDALKRAGEAQRKNAPSGPLGVPLQPVHTTPGPSWLPLVVVPVFLIAVLGLGVWLIVAWWNSREPATAAAVVTAPPVMQVTNPEPAKPAVSRPAEPVRETKTATFTPTPAPPVTKTQPPPPPVVTTPKPAPTPPPVQVAAVNPAPANPVIVEQPKPEPPKPVAATPAVAAPSTPPAPVPPAEPPKPEFPTLKVQGIFYSKTRPTALINGKPVFIGDKVDGAKIIRIERDTVTVEFEGITKMVGMN